MSCWAARCVLIGTLLREFNASWTASGTLRFLSSRREGKGAADGLSCNILAYYS